MTDKEKLDKAVELLKRWHLADWRFDLHEWVRDLRNFLEDDLEEDD